MAAKQEPIELTDRRLLERKVRMGGLAPSELTAKLVDLPDMSEAALSLPVDEYREKAASVTAARRARALEEQVDHRLPMAERNEDEHYEDELGELLHEDEDDDA